MRSRRNELDTVIVRHDALRRVVASIFRGLNVCDDDADEGANVLVTADLRGTASHGVSNMLRKYRDWFENGEIDPRPDWRVVSESASTANVDAARGLGIFLAPRMMRLAIEKARSTGIGMITIHGGRHLGMCAYHAMLALDHAMIGICMTASGPLIVPPNGRTPRVGSNPLAVAAPVRSGPPFVFDAAMSVVAGNRVAEARRTGSLLPPGVVADEEGRPILERSPAAETTRLLPLGSTPELGSHKGFGLAVAVEILAGILSGGGFAARNGFDVANHIVVAIDVGAFLPVERFFELMDDYLSTLRATPPRTGGPPVVIPGDRAYRLHAERTAHGIPLSREIVEWLERACSELNLPAARW